MGQSVRAGVTAGAAPTRYEFKPSLVGGACTFELTDAGLAWTRARHSGVWAYDKIAAIRLSYRPVSMQSRRFRADIENSYGERLTLYSTTWHTVALMSPQDTSYRVFIQELHRRIADSSLVPVLVGGINRWIFSIGAFAMALVCCAMIGLFIRALIVPQFAAALFLIGFAGLFVWQIGGFLWRNRPRYYSLDHIPDELLPQP